MRWKYDIYRHVTRPELRLVVRSGSDLPSQASKATWHYTGQEQSISRIEAAEIQRAGFAISRPRSRPSKDQ
jgi:hypothetical protein